MLDCILIWSDLEILGSVETFLARRCHNCRYITSNYVSTMPISTPYHNHFFFAVISCHRKCSENLLRYVVTEIGSHKRPTNVPPKMVGTGRAGYLSGTFERDVRTGRSSIVEADIRPPHLAPFVSSPILSGTYPTSSGEIGMSLLPCAPLRSPPEPLFANHNKGAVPIIRAIKTHRDETFMGVYLYIFTGGINVTALV